MNAQAEQIDINRADAAALAELPGIGPNLAQRIVEYRRTVHLFEEVIELTAVPGISERMVRAFADQVTVGTAAVEETAESAAGEEGAEEQEAVLISDVPLELASDAAEIVNGGQMEEVINGASLPTEAATEPEDAAAQEETVEPSVPETTGEATSAAEEVVDDDLDIVLEPDPPRALTTLPAAAERPADVVQPAAESADGGRGLGPILAGSLLGAVLGAVLTLAVLYVLNSGTLRYASDSRTSALERDISTEAVAAEQARSGLSGQLDGLQGQLEDLAAETSSLAQNQSSMEDDLAQSQEDLAGLQAETEALDGRISGLADAADNFNTFLNSLRDLLVELQGLPPEPTPTAEAEASPEASDQPSDDAAEDEDVTTTPNATEEPGEDSDAATTSTPQPTRTPRPTATPLVAPTTTPIP